MVVPTERRRGEERKSDNKQEKKDEGKSIVVWPFFHLFFSSPRGFAFLSYLVGARKGLGEGGEARFD